jgi:hypothetical protein
LIFATPVTNKGNSSNFANSIKTGMGYVSLYITYLLEVINKVFEKMRFEIMIE